MLRHRGVSLTLCAKGGCQMGGRQKNVMFANYPDVVGVGQMCTMLGGIGRKTAYDLLRAGEIRCLKIGRSFKIPKSCIIDYLIGTDEKSSAVWNSK